MLTIQNYAHTNSLGNLSFKVGQIATKLIFAFLNLVLYPE